MSERRRVSSDSAPRALGPYSQGIVHDGTLYCSGALPLDPGSGELLEGSLSEQTERCLRNLDAVCRAAGTALANAVQVTIYTTVIGEFAAINEAYAEFFSGDALPARVTVGVGELPLGAAIEIAATVAV